MKPKLKIRILNIILIAVIVSLLLPYPQDNSIIYERNPTFKWFGSGTLVLSKEKDLSNPILKEDFENNYKVKEKLNFETYYWKIIKENVETNVREFTIESKVAASIRDNKLTNEGNSRVKVLPRIIGAAVVELEPQGSLEINQSENVTYEVSQNE